MKIIIGRNKKNLIKKVKILSLKFKYIYYKYNFLKCHTIIYFINDRREEIKYNDIILFLSSSHKNNKILKLINIK